MAPIPQDRLVRKEVSLGQIREMEPPQTHIGLRTIAPFVDVQSDDVIFDYTRGLVSGLAPARAEDAESELAQKDESVGTGRASIIDWALKDHYDPSDVSRFREGLILGGIAGAQSLPLTISRMTDEFQGKLARDTAARRRKLDNRLEWLIITALVNGVVTYNDGKIKFTVDYGRPAGQTNQAPPGGLWSLTTSDPIGDALDVKQYMRDTYGVNIGRAIMSERIANSILNSDRFAARSGMTGATGGVPVDPRYLIDGWGPTAAMAVWARATGIQPISYDAVYRTRPIGSNTITNNRFAPDDVIIYLPSENDVDEIDDTVGFAATLTSPHVEGNWTPGFYEWEKDTGPDPWGHDRGNGIKAFPVFPHMELTYTQDVL